MSHGVAVCSRFSLVEATYFCDQVNEAKLSRIPGGHVQRSGDTSREMRSLPGRGEGDAVLRWYVDQ